MQQQTGEPIASAKVISVNFGDQVVLDNASLTIHEGDRIGLIGRNGSGKSTFLKILAGIMNPDDGELALKRGLRIGYLPQEFTLRDNASVRENIYDGAGYLFERIQRYESLRFDDPEKLQLEEELNSTNGWNVDAYVDRVMKALNVPESDRQIQSLSGGEKRRVAICRAIVSNPDLLILDEPTNHLDTDSIEWAEDFLANFSGTSLFVTHDRYFLDRIANRIVELNNGGFYSHQGNYTNYLINKAKRESVAETEERKRQQYIKRELDWINTTPKARRTKSKSRINQYKEMASQKFYEEEVDVELIIPPAPRLGKKILILKNAGVTRYNRTFFQNFFFTFEKNRKMGIIGKNGAGKTTFLKTVLGDIPLSQGEIEVGENTVFNYIDQGKLQLNPDVSVYQEIGEGREFVMFGKEKVSVWSYMKRFLFTDDRINTKVGRLSGGERSRLLLAKILKAGGNFLILDEPTNDLDLQTLRILEEALIAFDGCLLVVSHDRYFLNRVCNGILAFEENADLQFSEGNYDYYLEKKSARKTGDNTSTKEESKKADSRPQRPKSALKFKDKLELQQIEEKITEAESELEELEKIFADTELYTKQPHKIKELTEKQENLQKQIHKLYDRWQMLEEMKKLDEERGLL